MKKRYKLKKWYPSLSSDWKEGMIVGMGDRNWGFSPESSKYDCNKIVDSREVKFHPEFWEEVKEEKYEVIAYSQKGYVYKRDHPNWVHIRNIGYDIHSIKRLSDGEVFTIGDKIKTEPFVTDRKFTVIDEIYYNEHKQLSYKTYTGKSPKTFTFGEDTQHYKKPLFVTEDGVAKYFGDIYYAVYSTFLYDIFSVDINSPLEHTKNFSNKKAAEKYIDENKPIYSKKQINEALDKCTTVRAMSRNEFEHILGI